MLFSVACVVIGSCISLPLPKSMIFLRCPFPGQAVLDLDRFDRLFRNRPDGFFGKTENNRVHHQPEPLHFFTVPSRNRDFSVAAHRVGVEKPRGMLDERLHVADVLCSRVFTPRSYETNRIPDKKPEFSGLQALRGGEDPFLAVAVYI